MAGRSIPEIAASARVTRGVVSGAIDRYRKKNGLKPPGKGARTRPAHSHKKQGPHADAPRPEVATTKVERDGVTITLCPPGYADGYGWLVGIEE
jgi:transposase